MGYDRVTNRSFRPTYILYRQSVYVACTSGRLGLHCRDIRWASLVTLLVLGTPSSNDVADVSTLVLYLSVVAHDIGEGSLRDVVDKSNDE
jgi:hypothetical protein